MPPGATEHKGDARHTQHPIVHLKELGIENRTMCTQCTVFLLASRMLRPLIYEDGNRQSNSKESVGMQPQPT